MEQILLIILLVISVVNAGLLFKLTTRSGETGSIAEIKSQLSMIEKIQGKTESLIREEFTTNRAESNVNARQTRDELNQAITKLIESNEMKLGQINNQALQNREELQRSLKSFEDNFRANVKDFNDLQKQKFDTISNEVSKLSQTNEQKMDKMRETIEQKLQSLQEDNSQKLELMRATVDEKLQSTLEKRLGDSFKLVSDRLELVHKGLGEMQNLATGVGDLKKVLTNVKNRGILGEIQLENILEQILTPEQYEKNAATKKGSNDRVEFAIKLPGPDEDSKKNIWLPIDSKFPLEDYQRVLEAYDQANPAFVEEAVKQLEATIKNCAKTIRDKYIDPPNTTDFAIMFLPIEGLYAEVLRRTGVFETLQRDYKVIITGPNTLSALLNSLQMGFRTLTIQKRSSEVWTLLGAVKTEFGTFGTILEKTHKKLQEASNTIENASRKSRTIERKLRNVQELPTTETVSLLGNFEDMEENEGESA